MGKLDNQVALITGASSGMGLDTAKLFAKEGAKVVLLARESERLRKAAEEIRADGGDCLVTPADVRDFAQISAAVQAATNQYGKIDILVNSAGLGIFKTIEATDPEEIALQFDVNVKGTFLCAKAVLPGMQARKEGLIINVGSMAGVVPGNTGCSCYNGTKWALVGMSRCMAIEMRPDNVRVTLLNPGTTDTDFRPNGGTHPDWMQGTDVAEAALYVATTSPSVSIHEMTFSVTAHGW